MEKITSFEAYFNDPTLNEKQQQLLSLVRTIVHEYYPQVQERLAYGMPGYFPEKATKANQQLFLFKAAKGWLGIYGTFGFSELHENKALLEKYELIEGKGSIQIPYDCDIEVFRAIVIAVIQYNLQRFNEA